MRKANKIVRIVVSVLLILVLTTSCMLSGVFAKYRTDEDVYTKFSIKNFGVTVTATLDEDLRKYLKDNTTIDIDASKYDDNSISISIPEFVVHPGDDFSDAIHFTVSGTAEVAVRLKIQVSFAVSTDHYTVKSGVAGLEKDVKFLPMGTTFCADGDVRYLVEPWISNKDYRDDTGKNGTGISVFNSSANYRRTMAYVLSGMLENTKYEKTGSGTSTVCCVYKDFNPKATIDYTYKHEDGEKSQINEFAFGFKWPFEYDDHPTYSKEQLNEMEMYICNNKPEDSKITLKYIVTLEQIST